MEGELIKILLICDDVELSRRVAGFLPDADLTVEPSVDAGLSILATNSFHAVVFSLARANAAALFQTTLLTTRAAGLPVIVIGPENDEHFLTEAVFSGAQEYIEAAKMDGPTLLHAIRASVARHQERLALLEEKENYYGIFDHLVEGIFRTTDDGHYLLANVALAKIYGYDSPVELMANIKDIAGRLYVDVARREEFKRLMQEHDTLTYFQSQIFRKDGSVIWIEEN
ncbi:MAG TPA: PAS domain-containing protein, partial [Candidatus Sulfotelmatobacter sp.]|nr:PAS domain-containing protein [Candidatus Sulfotelmatobacter sp.]